MNDGRYLSDLDASSTMRPSRWRHPSMSEQAILAALEVENETLKGLA